MCVFSPVILWSSGLLDFIVENAVSSDLRWPAFTSVQIMSFVLCLYLMTESIHHQLKWWLGNYIFCLFNVWLKKDLEYLTPLQPKSLKDKELRVGEFQVFLQVSLMSNKCGLLYSKLYWINSQLKLIYIQLPNYLHWLYFKKCIKCKNFIFKDPQINWDGKTM